MSVIIRLQNLPWSANARDIRTFFQGLSIPEGGVHIVGGELGDAFIAFSTDEDARQAFFLDGGKIKEVQIKLLLSSRTEMQKVIEAARNPTPFMMAPQISQTQLVNPLQQNITQISALKESTKDRSSKKRSKSRDRSSRGSSRDKSSRKRSSRDRSRDKSPRKNRRRSRSREKSTRRNDRDKSYSPRKDRGNRQKSRERDRGRDRRRSKERYRKSSELDNKSNSDTSVNDPNDQWKQNRNEVENIDNKGNGVYQTGIWNATQKNNLNKFNNQSQPPQLFPQMQSLLDINASPGINSNMPPFINAQEKSHYPGNQRNFLGGRQNMIDNNNSNWQGKRQNDHFRHGGKFTKFNNDHSGMHGGGDQMSSPGNIGLGHSFQKNYRGKNFNEQNDYDNNHFDNNDNGRGYQNENNYQKNNFANKTFTKNCCVKILIGTFGYSDIRRFFQGLYISNDGIKIIHNDKGERTGQALVKFVRYDHKMEALQRDGQTYRDVVVDVKHCNDDEFGDAVDSNNLNSLSLTSSGFKKNNRFNTTNMGTNNSSAPQFKIDKHKTCIIASDLPPFTKEHDIITMFGENVSLKGILMIVDKDNNQKSFVHFNRAEDAAKFYSSSEVHVINGQTISIRLADESVFLEAKRLHNLGQGIVDIPEDELDNAPNQQKQTVSQTDCVVLKNFPLKTVDSDILDFFSDIGLTPKRIHVPSQRTSITQDSYCEFNSHDDAVKACAKNGTLVGNNDVYVELIKRRDMERAIGINHSPSPPPLESLVTAPPFQKPDKRFTQINDQQRYMPPVQDQFPPAQMFPNFSQQNRSQFKRQGPNHNNMRPLRQQQQGGNNYNQSGQNMDDDNSFVPDSFNNPNCVLLMENIPFRAGVDEILAFFNGYNLLPENILRRYNERNQPTGNAKVVFSSPQEAMNACNQLNNCKIWDRIIYLYLS